MWPQLQHWQLSSPLKLVVAKKACKYSTLHFFVPQADASNVLAPGHSCRQDTSCLQLLRTK
jgi:hypothetical protein